MSTTPKIVSLRDEFESMEAILASIAEDEDAVGFAAVVVRRNGHWLPVTFGVSRGDLAFAGAAFMRISTEDEQ